MIVMVSRHHADVHDDACVSNGRPPGLSLHELMNPLRDPSVPLDFDRTCGFKAASGIFLGPALEGIDVRAPGIFSRRDLLAGEQTCLEAGAQRVLVHPHSD